MAARRSSFLLGVIGLAGVAHAEGAPVIGFDQAVSQAMVRNPNARIAVEEIRRAHALLEQARAASMPSVSANAAYTRLDGGPLANATANLDANLGGANLVLGLPLIQPRGWVQWSHARENIDVARLSAEEVRRELAATVARTYLAIIAQRRVIEVSQRARATAESHYTFAQKRYAGGYGTRVDEVRAAEEVASDQTQVESAQAFYTRLRESLGVLVGVDHPLDATDDVSLPGPPGDADAEREAQTLRADVRLYRGRLALASRVRRDSWADYLPAVTATLQPFWQSQPTAVLPSWGWQLQLGLTWSLYDGGLRYGVIHERRSLETEAKLSLENAQRQAAAEVRSAQDQVKRSAAALVSAREAARLGAEALTLTNLGYQAGASTNIEVIDAERRARDSDTAVAQAEDAWRQALLDLLLATGHFPG